MPAILTQTNGDVLVVYFNDAQILDESKIQQISEELMTVVAKVPSGKLLLNFNEVKFMSSSVARNRRRLSAALCALNSPNPETEDPKRHLRH